MKQRVLTICFLIVAVAPAWAQVLDRVPNQQSLGLSTLPNGGLVASGTISGTILTFDGKAVRDAYITVRDVRGMLQASSYSLPNGTFTFENVPGGYYELIATVGIQEARKQVRVELGLTQVDLRISALSSDRSGSSHSVSVTEMKVPDKARHWVDKAEKAFRKHRLDEARRETDKALQIAPSYARALTLRSLIDLNENRVEEAQQELETAVKSDSHYGMAYIVLGAVYNMKSQFDKALHTLRQGISLVPNSWQGYFESAKALLGKGQYRESLREVNRAAQFAPDKYPPIHLVRGHALLGLKEYRGAITEFEQYLDADPNGSASEQARQTLDQARTFIASTQK